MKTIPLLLFIFLAAVATLSVSAQEKPDLNNIKPICNGLAMHLPKPEINEIPIDASVSGVVSVQVTIDEKGNVEKALAVSGHPLLRPAAEKAALQAKFRVTTDTGKPVKINCVLIYNFNPRKENELIVTAEFPQKIIVSVPKPEYPEAARFVNASGKVSVEVIIDENGNVESAKSVSGHPLLRPASEKAAMKAKFKPTTLSGKPLKARTYLIYNFISGRTVETEIRKEILLRGKRCMKNNAVVPTKITRITNKTAVTMKSMRIYFWI